MAVLHKRISVWLPVMMGLWLIVAGVSSATAQESRDLIKRIDSNTQKISEYTDTEQRLSAHLRTLRQIAVQRAILEDYIAREGMVVEQLYDILEAMRLRLPKEMLRLATMRPRDPLTVEERLDAHLADPTRRGVLLAQDELRVVAIRDSIMATMTREEINDMAANELVLPLDWYLKGRYELAEPRLTNFIQVFRATDSYEPAMLMLGDIYKNESRWSEAEQLFRTLTTSDTTSAKIRTFAYSVLEDIYYRQDRWNDAIQTYRQASDQFYSDLEAYDGAVYIAGDSFYKLATGGRTELRDAPPATVALLDSAVSIFNRISESSPVYILAQQQIAQCYIVQGRLEDAVAPLQKAEASIPPMWADEFLFQASWISSARLGHLYVELANQAESREDGAQDAARYRNLAVEQYSKVPEEALAYDEVLLSLAWLEMDKNNIENAVRLLEHLLNVRPDSEYIYEAWVTLGDLYTRLRNYDQAHQAFSQLTITQRSVDLINNSIAVSRDIDKAYRDLDRIAREAEARGDSSMLGRVYAQLDSLAAQKTRVADLQLRLFQTDPMALELVNYGQVMATLTNMSESIGVERGALNTLASGLDAVERQAASRNQEALTRVIREERQVASHLQSISEALEADIRRGLDLLRRQPPLSFESWLKEAEFGKVNIEFTRYQTYKANLRQQYEMIGGMERTLATLPENTAIAGEMQALLNEFKADADALESLMSTTRRDLIDELEGVIARYPESPSVEPMLFQLADVYYDQSERNFIEANEAYAAAFDRGEDPGDPPAPRYDRSIQAYQQLISRFPNSDFVAQSLFQLGHLYNEQGDLEESNRRFEELVRRYPEHDLVPDAYLRIGDYYFDALALGHTGMGGEELINRAIAAYDRVLDFPNDKNFQSALYKLGWSYYKLAAPEIREEPFDDSIRYFTYLLEDSLRVAEYKQAAEAAGIQPAQLDPGYSLTSEAIKYIAINFRDRVETGREGERRNWVTVPAAMKSYVASLGPDKPYARPLMMAMAEVYRETGQVEAEITAYDSLLSMYPMDLEAPRIMQKIIEGYEALDNMVKADPAVWDREAHNGLMPEDYVFRSRERLFREFGRSWAESIPDTAARNEALKLAEEAGWRLANYVAAQAEVGGNPTAGIENAAQYYKDYLTDFPEGTNAYTARWNYAIYMSRLKRYDEAYEEFITVSRDPEHDKYREQAALNAIFAAEKLLEAEKQQAGAGEAAPAPASNPN